MRSRGRISRAIGTCGLAAGLVVAVALPARAQVDPVTQADQGVAEAQAEVDQVANAYFVALEATRQLDAEIADAQRRVDALRDRLARLQQIAKERAAETYKRATSVLDTTSLDPGSPMESMRETVFVGVVTARDDDLAKSLRDSHDNLVREEQQLITARQEQATTVTHLQDEEQQVNAKLVVAQQQRQLAIAQQLIAQQQAAAAAQAEAAAAATARAAVPTPVPAGYTGTGGANPHHDDPYLTCIRHYESTDNYQAFNPGGPAYGAYQFLQSTWNVTANHTGRGDLIGLDPRQASPFDQDEMAWDLYQWQGKGPWSVDPC